MQASMRVLHAFIFISTYFYGISGACECGRSSSTRIIRGSAVSYQDYPWMARIIAFAPGNLLHTYCGAVMISTRYAVSAAHCHPNPLSDQYTFHLVFGNNINLESFQFEKSNVKRFVVTSKPNINEEDIAVIETNVDINVPPICLPPNHMSFVGVQATILGYGMTDNGFASHVMQAANVTVPSNEECNNMWGIILDTEICGGNYGGQGGTCRGDSGGPMMYYDEKSNRWILLGVSSWGPHDCFEPRVYGVFTRVSSWVPWIQENSEKAGCVVEL